MNFAWIRVLFLFSGLSLNSAFALEHADQSAIQNIIQEYTVSWNQKGGKGFAEDADFVNIFGMHFSGKAEIEKRHIQILQSFLKGSTLEILDSSLREVQPGLVVALVKWKLLGYKNPPSHPDQSTTVREGIFTQIFIQSENNWIITASQNTLKPN
jgi:uncharacterized protein (TIGR02246 family)